MKLRCQVTGNPCGTDTWPVGEPCICLNCLTTERDDLLDLLSEALPDTTPATGLHEEIAQTLFSLRGTQCLCGYCRFDKRRSEPPTIKRFGINANDTDPVVRAIGEDIGAMSTEEFEGSCLTIFAWLHQDEE